jgi:iron(III) transport system permease protein
MSMLPLPAVRNDGFDRTKTIQWLIAIATAVMVFAPLIPIVIQAFLDRPLYAEGALPTFDNFVRLAEDEDFVGVLWNTFVFAAVATVIAQFFGAATAVLIYRTNIPGRQVLGEILLWPLFVSHLVIAFGWFTLYGPSGYLTIMVQSATGAVPWNLYSLSGMAVVAGLSQAPFAYLMCLGAVSRSDPQLEDAARTVGAGPIRTLWYITVAMMRPAVVYSTVINFIIAVEMLSIPLLLGGPADIETITTFLYRRGISLSGQPDYGLIGAASIFLLAVVALLVWLQGKLMARAGRFVTVKGKSSRPAILDLGGWKWAAFIFIMLYVIFAILLVFAGVLMRASVSFLTPLIPFWSVVTLDNFIQVFEQAEYTRAIWNSIVVALVGGVLGTVVMAAITIVSVRSEFRFGRTVEYIAMFPRSLPGIIAGLGFFYAVVFIPGLEVIRGTIWILIAAFIMRYIPLGFGALAPSLAQIGADLDRGARISGADWWTTSLRIVIPLLKPALFSTFALLFIHFFKEYVTASFLYQPGSEIIGTVMLQLIAQGDNGPVSAMAAVQLVITALFVILARRVLGVRIYG